ncbi:coiled-coil domain-containing protein 181 [Xenopus laevis]|uniref:Coiled-coil domain-containing protein 181 n=2 Tax=Xenopus laevis TaxID=8355 RepID=A0A1L8HF80_XENLA|nr:coiled-coil domain-containing protein 181 [Xenopus laevis]XP_018102164.1 coiled-coil domain-containing protein 181 [Xenopus laevis]XP_041438053.1 coiled-coil domain-containing protein 181 [Xenopus laevis]OCT94739.1 hypothetical protein XELAEV_18012429mg [Xenopus laevis]
MSEKREDTDYDYEDDFEKDLDWLINEDAQSNADVQKEIKQEENGDEHSEKENIAPIPEVDTANPRYELTAKDEGEAEYEANDTEDEEARRYIAEKIEEANKLLETEIIDENRERKLKFKDNLVDLEVPPVEYHENGRNESGDENIVDGLSQLHLSNTALTNEHRDDNGHAREQKDGKILIEKDGKFELVTLSDIESQSFLPPINNSSSEKDMQKSLLNAQQPSTLGKEGTVGQKGIDGYNDVYLPQPPSTPKARPSSAAHLMKFSHRMNSPRRVQSAGLPSRNTTFCLSPEQKELQKRTHERQMKQKKEEEEHKKEEEEQKRKENEIAFKVWIHKKKDQFAEERRIQQAKLLEVMSVTEEERDPQKAFNLWLKRKHKERLREQKIDDLKKQEAIAYLQERGEGEKAFKRWLKEKRIQKRTEQQAALERSRRLLLDARRKKQIQTLLYSISDSRSFRYVDNYT